MPEPDIRVSAAVLVIGNEILSGRTQDSNLSYLSARLNDYGIQVREARVVPDLEDAIIDAVNALRARFDYVFTTGGIGPTHDDITAECIAKAFGVPLVINEEIAKILRSRPVPAEVLEARMRMARVPLGAGLIRNPFGPHGFHIGNVYVMAGVPQVMRAMIDALDGQLRRGQTIRSRSVTADLTEGRIARRLGEIQAGSPHIDLGSYPFYRGERHGTTLVMRGSVEAELDAMLELVRQMIVELGGTPSDEEQP